MTSEEVTGFMLWGLIFLVVFGSRWLGRRVSRNARPATPTQGTGPKWEQDKPMIECFEEDDL